MAGKTQGQPFWVLQQHDKFQVVEGKEAPSTEVQPGERMKSLYGPYATRADAEAVLRDMDGRTLRGRQEGRR